MPLLACNRNGAAVNAPSLWIRNCEAAEELEELFEAIIARGLPAPDEVALMRQRLRRNTQQHVEAQQVISLTMSYLRGGEAARQKWYSQTSRKERRNGRAGLPMLPPPDDDFDDDVA